MPWCLDFHASYRCRHAGACCRAGWTIPFEDGTVAARDADGACSFLDGTARRCSIHAAQGVHALPVSCRMFPRSVLHDGRGTFVSLSHFCPTAAGLLFDAAGDGAIVEAAPALAGMGELDGLDARGEWPPLLRPRLLMDLESYGEWERRAIALLIHGASTPRAALDALEDVTSRIAAWSPGGRALRDDIQAAFDAGPRLTVAPPGHGVDRAVKRWLAARLFAGWIAYQGDGLMSTLAYLRACLDTFAREAESDGNALEAVRRSDLRILHRP